ncbi:MAG TPA: helix-turn-helix domain-containing protein [Anaerolineales bacterium]|nr:helix-turn-helix domain-containing protein [Anaerolineales bacterium]
MSITIDMNNQNTIPFSDDQHRLMIDMYENGHTSRHIAKVFGLGQTTVLRRLRTLGVLIRGKGNPGKVKP